MVCDIFIRTYPGDAAYHEKCLQSIEKYCTGFRETVVIDKESPTRQIGYLDQQVTKLTADMHTDADFILIMDSDCMFTQPVTPETYLVDGRPQWLHTPWTPEMLAHPGTRAWHDCMYRFFKQDPPSEFMRRHPFMIPRWLLKELRKFCQKVHGCSIESYVMAQKSFSEFNVIGCHAWLHHHDSMGWVDTSKDPLPEVTLKQWWSHDPIEKNLEEINRILGQP
jgi:hypothetical protein